MCVNGVGVSAISRIKQMAWGTVARWLELAAKYAERFNLRMLKDFVIHELQADEIRTFVRAKKQVIWVLTTLEVWSRLWTSVVVGRRNFRNIKTVILGTEAELEEALLHSEDSGTLNTSFIERHNLTIRQGCAYLSRRTPCHARRTEFLVGHMALLMAYYNFMRPHRALKFGTTIRTPAMQAGLAKKCLSLRDVFTSQAAFLLFVLIVVVERHYRLDYRLFSAGPWRSDDSTTVA